MLLNNWLYYTVQGFCFQRFFFILFSKKIYIPVSENELKSICGKNFKISSFTCSLFIAGGFHNNKKHVLTGIYTGKIWYHINRITSPFSVGRCDGKGPSDPIDIIYSFGNSREFWHNFSTLSFEYFFHVVCNAKSQ